MTTIESAGLVYRRWSTPMRSAQRPRPTLDLPYGPALRHIMRQELR